MTLQVDRASHLSVILDLSPTQWHLSATASPHPLSLQSFLSQLFAFLNAHIASKNENTLAAFGAFPGKRQVSLHPSVQATDIVRSSAMLYATTESLVDEPPPLDANSFPPFKVVDTTLLQCITRELDAIGKLEDERTHTESMLQTSPH